MAINALKQVLFETASATADWVFPYKLIVPGMDWDPAIDVVVLGMSPDYTAWDDYGFRSRTFPPTGAENWAPWFQASSDDATGIVVLVDPNVIDIVVPWNRIRSMGPGVVNVGIQLRNKETESRTTLLTGRLPLMDGVI